MVGMSVLVPVLVVLLLTAMLLWETFRMRPSLAKWAITSTLIGLLVALTLLSIKIPVSWNASLDEKLGSLIDQMFIVLWPSSIALMATEGIESTPKGYLFLMISISGNLVLYGALGSIGWGLKRFTERIEKNH
jgi:putative effector of murein hydrolase LrgA (UPF0299 family)